MKNIALAALLVLLCGMVRAEEVSQIPNRMAISSIGEWVEFSLPDGYIQRHTVAERNGEGPEAEVIIRVESIYDGEMVETNLVTEVAGEPESDPPVPEDAAVTLRLLKDSFTVKGVEYQGVAVEVSRDGQPYQTWYVSADIPVYGLGKRTSVDGESDFEVADFGIK